MNNLLMVFMVFIIERRAPWPDASAAGVPVRQPRLRPLPALWQGSAHYPACFPGSRAFAARCRSSVVEHSLGKGEVVSSILTGSTTYVHHAVCAASAASSDG